ncbi:hypothetical protein AB0J52_09020 [Spirillospora sp. NPDC049652]
MKRSRDSGPFPSGGRHLMGHSIGAATALDAATAHTEVRLTLVSPFFLQARPREWRPLTHLYLRHVTAQGLARWLTGDLGHANALASSAQDLRRGTAAATARLLAQAASPEWRDELTTRLRAYPAASMSSTVPNTHSPPRAQHCWQNSRT